MRIDHLIYNIDEKYQQDDEFISKMNEIGFLYNPKKGKKTKGFKVSNVFIGKEYLEFVNILGEEGEGFRKDWVELNNKGYKGCTCIMLETTKINALKRKMVEYGIEDAELEQVSFKLAGLFTKTMPWDNLYLPAFEHENIQIGFQQYKKSNYLEKMHKKMVPNSEEFGITEITDVVLYGNWSTKDYKLLSFLFYDYIIEDKENLVIKLNEEQTITFRKGGRLNLEVYARNNRSISKSIRIENTQLIAGDIGKEI